MGQDIFFVKKPYLYQHGIDMVFQFVLQLVLKNISKVNLGRRQSPDILSEIIGSQENGGEGKQFSSGNLKVKDSHIVPCIIRRIRIDNINHAR